MIDLFRFPLYVSSHARNFVMSLTTLTSQFNDGFLSFPSARMTHVYAQWLLFFAVIANNAILNFRETRREADFSFLRESKIQNMLARRYIVA